MAVQVQSDAHIPLQSQRRMRFDNHAAVLAGTTGDLWDGQRSCVVPLKEFCGWRRIEEQYAAKLDRAKDYLPAVFRDRESANQRLDREFYQYCFQEFRLCDQSAKASICELT